MGELAVALKLDPLELRLRCYSTPSPRRAAKAACCRIPRVFVVAMLSFIGWLD
jgi:hypothetical protein